MTSLSQITNSLNDFTFSVTLPSTIETVYGRPYTIKDEFKLAQLQTVNGNEKLLLEKIGEFIREKYYSLTDEQYNKLTMVDVQYLLARLKMESDDKIININLTCDKCGGKIKHQFDLDNVKVNSTKFTKTFEIEHPRLTDILVITIKTQSFVDIIKDIEKTSDENFKTDDVLDIIIDSIKTVSLGSEKLDISDREELKLMIESIPKKYLEEISEFLNNSPKLVYETSIVCTNKTQDGEVCGNEIKELDVSDFFHILF